MLADCRNCPTERKSRVHFASMNSGQLHAKRLDRWCIDQIVRDRILQQLGIVIEVHFKHYARLVSADSLHAEVKVDRNFTDAAARCEHAEYLKLPIGKVRVKRTIALGHYS